MLSWISSNFSDTTLFSNAKVRLFRCQFISSSVCFIYLIYQYSFVVTENFNITPIAWTDESTKVFKNVRILQEYTYII